MGVRRIVANLHAPDPAALAAFYRSAFGLHTAMDMDWICFVQGDAHQHVGVQLAQDGGSGTELPALSIEVDDLDQAEEAVRNSGGQIVYGPVTEPWGIRRLYLRDPAGNLINVATHQ